MKRTLSIMSLFLMFSLFFLDAQSIETFYITSNIIDTNALPSSFNQKIITIDEENLNSNDSVKEALEKVPGVSIISMGGPMAASQVRLRGSTAEQVVILVDGRRINSIQSGKYDISSIPLYNVERIEILEGALSSRYGENAIGGVVNIVTKKNNVVGTFITSDVSYGSYNSFKGSLFFQSKKPISLLSIHPFTNEIMNYPLSSFSYSFGAYAHYSNGEYPYVHQLTNNRITRINANGVKFGLSSSFFFDINRVKEIAIGGDFSLYLDKKGVPGAIEFPSYYATLQDKKLSTAITYQYKNNPLFSIEIDSFFSYSYRLWDPNRTSSNPSRFSVHENSAVSCALSLQRDDEIGEFSSLLSIHSSFRYDTLHSSDLESLNSSAIGVSDSFYRIHTDIALHDTFSFKNLSIIPSFRVDTHDIRNWDQSYSSLATHLSSNVGASLRLYDNLTFKLNIGSAYRVPSFDDMFWSSSAFAVGNPYLRSEHAFSFDVSFDYKVHKLISISALYFSNSIKDLIQWIPSADGKWSPHNIGLVEKRGVNWAVKIDIPLNSIIDTSISLDYQYIDAVDMGIGGASYQKKLPFIAPHIFKGTFSIGDTSQWNAEIDISYTSYRFITAANTKIAPHNVLINTSLLFSLTTNWILTLKINNLTNQEYYDAQFYPIPGIHGNITLTYKGEHKK